MWSEELEPERAETILDINKMSETIIPLAKAACEAIDTNTQETSSIVRFMMIKYKCLIFLILFFLFFLWSLIVSGISFFQGKNAVETIMHMLNVTTTLLQKIELE
jgi:hypothetical protein